MSGIAIGTLIAIIKKLNVSADYILFGIDTEKIPLNTKIKQIQPHQKKYLEELINTFIDCCLDEKCIAEQQSSCNMGKECNNH